MMGHVEDAAREMGAERMSISEVLTEIPWPNDWCLESLLDKIAARSEERQS